MAGGNCCGPDESIGKKQDQGEIREYCGLCGKRINPSLMVRHSGKCFCCRDCLQRFKQFWPARNKIATN